MTDQDIYLIVALLPLTAIMLVSQSNPYHALILRGILGAVAALVYAVLGAADVALTEALVGTMLAITLYAVAVRSSLVMRLGILTEEQEHLGIYVQPPGATSHAEFAAASSGKEGQLGADDPLQGHTEPIVSLASLPAKSASECGFILKTLQTCMNAYHVRIELVPYSDLTDLKQALADREIHAYCILQSQFAAEPALQSPDSGSTLQYILETRVQRLHEIFSRETILSIAALTYVNFDSQSYKTPSLSHSTSQH